MSGLDISTPTKENYPFVNKVHSKRAQWYSPCKSSPRKPITPESDLPSLKLNHFSKIPKISFGNVKAGDRKTEPFVVLNPHPSCQILKVEKCPSDKGFSVDGEYSSIGDSGETFFNVPPNEEVFLSVTWEPKESGKFREIIQFTWEHSHRLQVIVFGTAVGPTKTKACKSNAKVQKKSSKVILQPSQVPNTCQRNIAKSFESKANVIFGFGKILNREDQTGEDLRRETYVVKGNVPQVNDKYIKLGKLQSDRKSREENESQTPKKPALKTPVQILKKPSSADRASAKTKRVIGTSQWKKKLSPVSGPVHCKPKPKVKLKVSAKGVPQRKLRLVKTPKSSLPRHPMPFAAKNMYYDERWIEKQQEGFTRWLNFVLTPVDETETATVQDTRKGTVALFGTKEMKKSQPLAPTREVLSLRAYTARRKMARLRRSACLLFQSQPLVYVIRKVEAEVENGRLAIRPDKKLHADLGIKQQVIEMILSYNTLWLRIGLETVYGEILPIHSNNDVTGLARFLTERLLGNPDIAKAFSHPQVPGLFREGYVEQLGKFTLKKFLLLVFFLDQAKLTRLIDHDPCLFSKDASFKSSRSLLLTFSREYLKGEGDVTKHLNFLGYAVTHSQKAIDEVDYAVKNIATDLRDGLRLTRVVELLTRNWQLTSCLRVPAISRLQKIHNVEVFMKALKKGNVLTGENGSGIDARHIVDGHREKTLALLWQIIFHFQVSVLLNEKQLQEEINHLESTTRLRTQLTAAKDWVEEDDSKTSRRDSTGLYFQSNLLRLLLKWCKVVCSLYGAKIENFTVSFSDGRALCYLLQHYHPSLLPLEMIKQRTTLTCNPGVQEGSDGEGEDAEELSSWTASFSPGSGRNILLEELNANERENFRLMAEKVQELGGVPLMAKTADMSNTIPDEKVVITYVAYLCVRLLDLREETKAARCIQMAWRRHRLKKHQQHRQNVNKIVVFVQAHARAVLARRRFQVLRQAAVLIQSVYRGHLARTKLQVRHRAARSIQARYHAYKQGRDVLEWFTIFRKTVICLQRLTRRNQSERRRRRNRAAAVVQAAWRGYRARREFHGQKEACMKLQCFARKVIALRRFQRLKQAAVQIQTWYRAVMIGKRTRREFLRLKKCVVRLQSLFRGKRDRDFARNMRAAIKIQSLVRAWHARSKFLGLKRATIKMQAQVRMCQAEKRFLTVLNAVKILQLRFRAVLLGRQQRKEYQRRRRACIKLQSVARGCILRKQLAIQKRACIIIQAEVRKYLQQKRYQRLQASTKLIQTRYRRYLNTKEVRQRFLRLKHSAVKVQSCYRGYKCRKNTKRVKDAVIVIQSCVRRHLCRKKFLSLRKAALTFQARYRALLQGRSQRMAYERIRKNVIRLQAVVRGNVARRRLRRQCQAAVVIQAYFRRYAAVKRYHSQTKAALVIQRRYRWVAKVREEALQYSSAVHIQAAFRGFRARCLFRTLKATVVLQSAARGWKVRKDRKRDHHAALVIQTSYRAHVASNKYRTLKAAALTLQRRYRALQLGRNVRTSFKLKKDSTVRIQSSFRGYLVRKELKRHKAAARIQATYRGYVARKSFKVIYASVIRAQAVVRCYLARKHFASLKRVTILLQRRYRARVVGMCQYLKYHVQRGACIVLQAAARGRVSRKRYLEMRKSAIVFQQRYRANITARNQRERYLALKTAATHLQAGVRGWRDRKVARKERAARFIQSMYKMHRVRQEYLSRRRAVILMQAQIRMVQQRRRFVKVTKSAVVIQRRFRATKLCRQEQMLFHLTRGAVITIQMAARGYLVRSRLRKMNIAAIKIQAYVRCFLERKRYQATRRAVLVLQLRCRAWRLGRAVARNYSTLKYSAVVIQSCYRDYRLRSLRKRHEAATTIQSAFRRYVCRSEFLFKRRSVIIIQTAVKGFLSRRRFFKLRSATLVIQQRFRAQRLMQKFREDFVVQRRACIVIQSWVRRWLYQQRFISIRRAVVILQQYHRAYIEARKQRRSFVSLRGSTVTLQSYVRMHLIRSSYLKTKQAVIKVQATSRMIKERKSYQSLRHSAIALQRRFRANQFCKEHRAAYQKTRESVILMQSHVRGFQARQMVQRMVAEQELQNAAAVKIQRFYRGFHLMKKTCFAYHVTRGAVITIQSAYRMFTARTFFAQIKAVITIQAFYRGWRARRDVAKIKSAILIQAAFRGFVERQTYLHTKKTVVKMQAIVRGRHCFEEYQKLKSTCLALQRRVRANSLARHARKDFIATKRAIVRLQSGCRGWRARAELRRIRAVCKIQRWFRAILNGRRLRREYQQLLSATLLIQAAYRGYCGRLRAREMRAARTIQAVYRGFVTRKIIEKQNAARHARLVRFTSAVFFHSRAIIIQRYFCKAHAMAKAKARMESILFIQFWWRGIRERQRFRRLQWAAVVAQKAARRRLMLKHRNAAMIQALVRGALARKRLRKMQESALQIQALWRGYCVRRDVTASKVEKARKRIKSANAAACESMKLCNRTRSALDFLLRCKNISRILEALVSLEVVTRLSWVCCEQVVSDGALSVIFKVIRKCNRSLPHMEIIKYSISILFNVAACPYLYRAVYEEQDSVETLVELLTNFRDKSAVFSSTCCLLSVLCRDSVISQDLRNRTKAVEHIKSLHILAERKYQMETKRNTVRSKVEKSVCPRPPPTPCKHTPYKAKKRDWLKSKERAGMVQDPLEAVRSLVRCLGLDTGTVVE